MLRILLGLSLLACLAVSPKDAPLVGYIGCSNTYMTWQGIPSSPNYWPTYYTGGASIDKWALNAYRGWDAYDAQVDQYGQPDVVWVQVCENEVHPVTAGTVEEAIAILRAHSPQATIVLSPISDYDPVALCIVLGPDGNLDIKAMVDEVVAGDRSIHRGPDTGPLTIANTDPLRHCHPNQAARVSMASQLTTYMAANFRT